MKFMGKVADILANAGHNVTILQPVVNDFYLNKKIVKNPTIEIRNYFMDEEGIAAMQPASGFKFFWEFAGMKNPIVDVPKAANRLYEEFEHVCRKMLVDKDLHQWILNKNFDAHISEAFDFCGLYLADYLNLKSPIPLYTGVRCGAASHAVGEPSPWNYLPAQTSNYGPGSTGFDRINDIYGLTGYYYQFGLLFDKQYQQAYQLTNGRVRHWKDILKRSTFYLTNSNPYLSFTTPTISKVVQVGGCTIDPPKSTNLSTKFDEYLSRRNSTILVSFGTVIQSSDMPESFKIGLIDAFKSMPDITFIWKYEGADILDMVPDNVIISDWVPQPALLADQRVKIFVTHGGLGSTMEVAYAGTPSIMVPVFSDQGVNARMLAKHGGAVVFNKFDLPDSKKIKEAFERILDDGKFGASARKLADILRNQPMDPKEILLRHCEFAARFGEISNLEPFANNYNFIEFYCIDAIFIVITPIIVMLYLLKYCWFLTKRKLKME